jgi:hypothetical protein
MNLISVTSVPELFKFVWQEPGVRVEKNPTRCERCHLDTKIPRCRNTEIARHVHDVGFAVTTVSWHHQTVLFDLASVVDDDDLFDWEVERINAPFK